jgi:UDP-N-acetylmuramoyl-L-alanyl-D-glutamate--2,6-diaminopimelate ligase
MMPAASVPVSHMLSALLTGLAKVGSGQDRAVTGLSLDSRSARAGDLFLACSGAQGHGLQYIEQALQAGVAAVVWEPSRRFMELPPPLAEARGSVPAFAIEGLGNQIGVIADRFYGHPSQRLHVIGVTGTDGKTSCSQFLAKCLDGRRGRCGVIGTLGYGLYGELTAPTHTTPDAIRVHRLLAEMADGGARYVVMEVSSHGLEQGRAAGVAFDIAVLTNLSRDHLDYHGDTAAYARAKRRLFEMPGLRMAVLNLDDGFGRELLQTLPPSVARTGYGFHGFDDISTPQVLGSELHLHHDGFSLQVSSPWGSGSVQSTLLGGFNASNVLAVLTVLLVGGLPFDEACSAVQSLSTVPGRMERFGGDGRPTVVVDYAHTPEALRHVLEALRGHVAGELWCVFGCGGDRDRGKRALMGGVAEQLADRVVVTDDNPRHEDPQAIVADILSGMQEPDRARVLRDRGTAIRAAVEAAAPQDLVLVAGKGHETLQLVGDQRLPFSDREQVRRLVGGPRS